MPLIIFPRISLPEFEKESKVKGKELKKLLRYLEEKGYITGKKTIQIKFDQKVPTTAIKQILKAQAKMNESKRAIK